VVLEKVFRWLDGGDAEDKRQRTHYRGQWVARVQFCPRAMLLALERGEERPTNIRRYPKLKLKPIWSRWTWLLNNFIREAITLGKTPPHNLGRIGAADSSNQPHQS
jgi:hypothetical protein